MHIKFIPYSVLLYQNSIMYKFHTMDFQTQNILLPIIFANVSYMKTFKLQINFKILRSKINFKEIVLQRKGCTTICVISNQLHAKLQVLRNC